MRKLIYNNEWIVCGYTIGTKESQLEEIFNNLKPYDEVTINLNNREKIPAYLKDAFVEASLLFLAALQTGIMKLPISNANFYIVVEHKGIVLMPNIKPFSKAVQLYEKGTMPFESHVHIVNGSKVEMIGSFSAN